MSELDETAIKPVAELAVQAGSAIMRYFGNAKAQLKSDGSPVTLADAEAEAIITPGLQRLFPGTPVIAEEAASSGILPETGKEFFLVDPLDGTREFLAGNHDFTVNIGLVRDRAPVAGVIFAPASARLWIGADRCHTCDIAPGERMGSSRNWREIHVRPLPSAGLIVAASRSHRTAQTEEYVARLPVGEYRKAGSSLKFCLVAEGAADVYPRFGPTMEWDTCAGHAIVAAAGGVVCAPDGRPFLYGKREQNYRNREFIATSDFDALMRVREA